MSLDMLHVFIRKESKFTILFCEGRSITNKESSIQKRYLLNFFLEVAPFLHNCAALFSFAPLIKHKYRENWADDAGKVAVATPLTGLKLCCQHLCPWQDRSDVSTGCSKQCPSCTALLSPGCRSLLLWNSNYWLLVCIIKQGMTDTERCRSFSGFWLSAQIPFFSHACRDPVNSTEFGIIDITWYLFAFRHMVKLSSACGLCSLPHKGMLWLPSLLCTFWIVSWAAA